MKRLDKPGVAIASLTVGLSAISYVLALVLLGSRAASDPDQNQETALPAGSIQEVAVNGTCRRVVGQGYPLLARAGRSGQEIRFINAGQRVALVGSSTVRGSDGDLYIQVSVPYGSSSPDVGFMPAQTQLDGGGELESTLAFCRASDYGSTDNYGSTNQESDRNSTSDDSWQEGYPSDNDFSTADGSSSAAQNNNNQYSENNNGISAYW